VDLVVTRSSGRRARTGDRGSVTLFVVFFAITVLVLASLLVDVGNAVNAQERAADLAEQAARAAADTLNLTDLRDGNVTIDTAGACANASAIIQTYARTSGIKAAMAPQGCTYQGPGPRQVTVYVSITTTPVITTFFGSFTMTAHETACAEFGINQGVAC
jgi:Flp pilus assembly protein TadG